METPVQNQWSKQKLTTNNSLENRQTRAMQRTTVINRFRRINNARSDCEQSSHRNDAMLCYAKLTVRGIKRCKTIKCVPLSLIILNIIIPPPIRQTTYTA